MVNLQAKTTISNSITDGVTDRSPSENAVHDAIAEITTYNYTPENTANKSGDIAANNTSTTQYPTIKGVFDWVTSLLTSYLPTSSTTANVPPLGDRQYITTAQQTILNNTSGTNTGDETTSTIKSKLGASVENSFLGYVGGILSFFTATSGNLHNKSFPLDGFNIISGTGTVSFNKLELNSRYPLFYTSSTGTNQEAEAMYEGILPEDFLSFPANAISVWTKKTGTIGTFNIRIYNSAGTLIVNTSISPTNTNVWESKQIDWSGSWLPGDNYIFKIYWYQPQNSSQFSLSRLKIKYNRKLFS